MRSREASARTGIVAWTNDDRSRYTPWILERFPKPPLPPAEAFDGRERERLKKVRSGRRGRQYGRGDGGYNIGKATARLQWGTPVSET